MRRILFAALASCALMVVGSATGSTSSEDVRLTNDCHPLSSCGDGYLSANTLATGRPYSDATLNGAHLAREQNEPAVGLDPRDPNVLIGSSNDYCGVYNSTANGTPLALGPIWLGYYRSTDGGSTWLSSLVPGYPDDASEFRSLSDARPRVPATL